MPGGSCASGRHTRRRIMPMERRWPSWAGPRRRGERSRKPSGCGRTTPRRIATWDSRCCGWAMRPEAGPNTNGGGKTAAGSGRGRVSRGMEATFLGGQSCFTAKEGWETRFSSPASRQVLARMGAKVTVECQPALVDLLRTIEGIEVRELGHGTATSEQSDFHCPLMSVPAMLGAVVSRRAATVRERDHRLAHARGSFRAIGSRCGAYVGRFFGNSGAMSHACVGMSGHSRPTRRDGRPCPRKRGTWHPENARCGPRGSF